MVLEETSERRVLPIPENDGIICYYTDILLGLYLVRGDSMVLLGEVDTTSEDPAKDDDVEQRTEGLVDDNNLVGSGLLKEPTQSNDTPHRKKQIMKKVTLEEFENLETNKNHDEIEELVWEFDLDLVA